MAEVYKAEITAKPEIQLALKRILPQFSGQKELITMLINEAGLAVGLNHPNIVPILDFGIVDDIYFIAMEYVHGKDLRQIMLRLKARNMEVPIPMAVHIVRQLLRGLDYAHHKCDNFGQPLQIVHRDISPQNIIVSFSGEVKILDFGIAKAVAKSGETKDGTLKGKISYMSPEQASGDEIDPRTDIFSAGTLLWELLTLQSCFTGETDMQVLDAIRNADVRSPSAVNKKIPEELSAVVLKALQKKPKNRYNTAAEFADALEAYQKERFGTVQPRDLSVFLSTLYSLSPDQRKKISAPKPVPAAAAAKGPRAPWIKKTPGWVWKAPLTLAVWVWLCWFAWKHPPSELFALFDAQAVRLAEKVNERRNLRFSPPVAPPAADPMAAPDPMYALHFTPQARERLDSLPFETFERVRDKIADLAFKPHPKDAVPNAKRPGSWLLAQSGYKILYRSDDFLRAVTVERIDRSNP